MDEKQVLTNEIYNIHGYSDVLITYQQSKDWPIYGDHYTSILVENRGGFISFVILVGDHRALWIELHEIVLLGFWKHEIIPPTEQNLCMEDLGTIKKSNDTLHTIFVKHDIYQKIHYLHSRAIYSLQSHLAWGFELLDELISLLINAVNIACRRKITGRVKWSPEYEISMDLLQI